MSSQNSELVVIAGLINDPDLCASTISYFKKDVFDDPINKYLFTIQKNIYDKFNTLIDENSILIEVPKLSKKEDDLELTLERFNELKKIEKPNHEWFMECSEKFLRERMTINAVKKAIELINSKKDTSALPDMFEKAVTASFDKDIGLDFLSSAEARFEARNRNVVKIPTGSYMLDKATDGGFERKTINIIVGGCVHPDTVIRIRMKKNEEMYIKIKDVKELLDQGYELEVESPDGWVGINYFIDKGPYEEYVLDIGDGRPVRVNAEHKFETSEGWKTAKEIHEGDTQYQYLTRFGYKEGTVTKTGNIIPIVDINVNHPNHRYYTENVSSHNTGLGKTLSMIAIASNMLRAGYNVLHVTLELSEEKTADRYDANLLNINLGDLRYMSKDNYLKGIKELKNKSLGQLRIKEYPSQTCNKNHLTALIREYELKEGLKFDVVVLDYINIAAGVHTNIGMGTYGHVKAMTEEFRAVAMAEDLCMITATQSTRGGYGTTDLGLQDVSESFGLAHGADFIMGISQNDDLKAQGRLLCKQLKSRYGDIGQLEFWTVGIDKPKQKWFDVDLSQDELKDMSRLRQEAKTSPDLSRLNNMRR